MPSFNTVKFNSLEGLPSVKAGDFIIVEDEIGTKKLDYNFFILQPNNTSFYTAFMAISSGIIPLSGQIDSFTASISNTSNIVLRNSLSSLSATIGSYYNKIYYRAGTLTVIANQIDSPSVTFSVSAGVTLSAYDVRLAFNGTGFQAISGRIVNVFPVLSSTSPGVYNLRVRLTGPSTYNTPVIYNIFKPY